MNEILITKEELISEIMRLSPALEWSEDSFWGNYGYFYFGIGDGYNWDESKLKQEDEIILWKIYAFITSHLYRKYSESYWKKSSELQKFFKFSWEARKYIKFEKTDYKSHFEFIDVILDFIREKSK